MRRWSAKHQAGRRERSARSVKSRPPQIFELHRASAATSRDPGRWIEQGFPAVGPSLSRSLGEMLDSSSRRFSTSLQRLLSTVPKPQLCKAVSAAVRGVRSSGDHPQPPFLHPEPIISVSFSCAAPAAGFELESRWLPAPSFSLTGRSSFPGRSPSPAVPTANQP